MNESTRRTFLQGALLTAGTGLLPAQTRAASGRASNSQTWNVQRFGAKGDGKHDDTSAMQKALDEAGHTGGIVFVPAGTYRVDGTLIVPQSVCLEGAFKSPPRTGVDSGGSILLALSGKGQDTGAPFLALQTNSTLKGLTVFYPEQSSDIVPYPPTVQGNGDDCSIVDVLLLNPYYGVDFGTHPCGRHWIKSLYMQALSRGLYVAECFDVGRIEDVHVWPFWRTSDPKIDDYTAHHGEAFVLGRTDWEYMSNCFCINYKTGYRFMASKSGPGNVLLTQCGSDEGPVSTSVLVEETQGHAGVSFVNSQFMGRQQVQVMPTNTGPIKFTACGFWGQPGITGTMALLQGKGQVTFNGCHFINWALAGDTQAPAIVAEHGGLAVATCDFMDSGKQQIALGSEIEAATIVGSRLRGGPRLSGATGANVALAANI